MILDLKKQAKLLQETQGAAAALIEDLQYIRSIISKGEPASADVRRLSALLRRIVVEKDLVAISAPRLGEIKLIGPDNRSAYRTEAKHPFLVFVSGRANVMGAWSSALAAFDLKGPAAAQMPPLDHNAVVEMSIDTFRRQKVICYRGVWVNRQEVIKYVANNASGVHSTNPKSEAEIILSKIRNSVLFRRKSDGNFSFDLFPGGIDTDVSTFNHRPDAIDGTLIELLAAATFLLNSPFIVELEKTVCDELAGELAP